MSKLDNVLKWIFLALCLFFVVVEVQSIYDWFFTDCQSTINMPVDTEMDCDELKGFSYFSMIFCPFFIVCFFLCFMAFKNSWRFRGWMLFCFVLPLIVLIYKFVSY